jgi:hypothetical protein
VSIPEVDIGSPLRIVRTLLVAITPQSWGLTCCGESPRWNVDASKGFGIFDARYISGSRSGTCCTYYTVLCCPFFVLTVRIVQIIFPPRFMDLKLHGYPMCFCVIPQKYNDLGSRGKSKDLAQVPLL